MSDTWDGKPQNPEQDSEGYVWHTDGRVDIFRWNAEEQWYEDKKGRWATAADFIADGDTYHGRIISPAEVAAREAAAYQRGQEDMRERAAVAARFVPIPEDASAVEAHGRMTAAMQAGLAILDLTIKEAPHE